MTPLMSIMGLEKRFPVKRGLLDALARRPKRVVTAVDQVSLDIYAGDCLGLVGESGCGKSSLAKTLIRLYQPDGGTILLNGRDISHISRREMQKEARNIQMIFQDPYSSLNPRMPIGEMLREALVYHKVCPPELMESRVRELLNLVGLSDDQGDRFPGEFSGGQRQRVGIARALALEPRLIIADEPVSALDVSIQAQVINLLIELRKKLGLTMLFISHDLRVVRYITNRVAVMYLGKIVESAPTEEFFEGPLHPYSQILLQAAPSIDRPKTLQAAARGELPSPMDIPRGCRFHPRCPYAQGACTESEPELREILPGHFSACPYRLVPDKGVGIAAAL